MEDRKRLREQQKTLGATFKRIREHMGLKACYVAEQCGLHPSFLCRIENGVVPISPRVFERLALMYGKDGTTIIDKR